MAVPSSGPLGLREDINLEVNGNVTDTNVALHQLSLDSGFSTPDAMSDFYGYSSVVPPSVTTNNSTSVSDTSMTINGTVSDTGGENVYRGFYHGTNSVAATNNPKYTLGGTQGTGAYSCVRGGLPYATTYYIWAWACNSAGQTNGNRCATGTAYPPYSPGYPQRVIGYGNTCARSEVGTYADSSATFRFKICTGYINPYSGGRAGILDGQCNRHYQSTPTCYPVHADLYIAADCVWDGCTKNFSHYYHCNDMYPPSPSCGCLTWSTCMEYHACTCIGNAPYAQFSFICSQMCQDTCTFYKQYSIQGTTCCTQESVIDYGGSYTERTLYNCVTQTIPASWAQHQYMRNELTRDLQFCIYAP